MLLGVDVDIMSSSASQLLSTSILTSLDNDCMLLLVKRVHTLVISETPYNNVKSLDGGVIKFHMTLRKRLCLSIQFDMFLTLDFETKATKGTTEPLKTPYSPTPHYATEAWYRSS